MVYVGYWLYSYGIPISIREVLWILGGGTVRYLHIAQYDCKVLFGVSRSFPRPLLECTLYFECLLNELVNVMAYVKKVC